MPVGTLDERGRLTERGRILSAAGRIVVPDTGAIIDSGSPLFYAAEQSLAMWLRADLGVTTSDASITNPDEFDNAAWTKVNLTVTANATTDPLGGSAADKFTDDATAGQHRVSQTQTNGAIGHVTFTVYAKAGTLSWILIQCSGAGKYFDVTNGLLGTSLGAVETSSITDAGNGWWLCSLTATQTGTSFDINLASADNTASYSGGTGTAFFFRAVVTQTRVSQWSDQSGQGKHWSQVSAAAQPVLTTLSGKSVIRGSVSKTMTGGVNLGANITMIMVSARGAGANNYIVGGASGMTSFVENFVGSSVEWFGNGVERAQFASPTAGELHLYSVRHADGGTYDLTYDRAAVASGSSNQVAATQAWLALFSTATPSNHFTGYLAELILFRSILPDTVLQNVLTGVRARQGTP
jgi:hypothetical protein